jgi:asparagine synthase (glutamine-hydrolysing)
LLPTGFIGRRTLRLLAISQHARYQRMNALFENHDLRSLLVKSNGIARPLITERIEAWSGIPLVSQLQQVDFEIYLPSTVLVKVDRASMLNSLEVRAPLLDHHLLEFLGRLPTEWRWQKRILKDAIRGLVPDRVLTRPKQGFGVPLSAWFQGDFGAYLREILLDQPTRQRGLLNMGYVETLIQRQGKPWTELSLHLWSVLMFELWCRAYKIS